MVLLSEPAYAISAIATQGAVIERSWVSSYLFYGRFVNDPYYPATDDKGHIKVAFITNFLRSYLKLVSQFKEKRALRPVVNVVCSVHKKTMEELCSYYRHSFSCRFFFFQEFKGNSDQSSIVRHWLKHQFYATWVFFYPTSYVGRMCMSVEVYGCRTGDISMLTPFSSKQRQREGKTY